MDEAQVVAGIPTLSADPKTGSRPEGATVTPTTVTQPVTKTESRSTSSSSPTQDPSIYRRKSQALPVGNGISALPRWPFWVADGVLVVAAVTVWLLAPRPMSIGSIALAAALIVIGAVLALVPWLSSQAPKSAPQKPAADTSSEQAPPLQRLPFKLQ